MICYVEIVPKHYIVTRWTRCQNWFNTKHLAVTYFPQIFELWIPNNFIYNKNHIFTLVGICFTLEYIFGKFQIAPFFFSVGKETFYFIYVNHFWLKKNSVNFFLLVKKLSINYIRMKKFSWPICWKFNKHTADLNWIKSTINMITTFFFWSGFYWDFSF